MVFDCLIYIYIYSEHSPIFWEYRLQKSIFPEYTYYLENQFYLFLFSRNSPLNNLKITVLLIITLYYKQGQNIYSLILIPWKQCFRTSQKVFHKSILETSVLPLIQISLSVASILHMQINRVNHILSKFSSSFKSYVFVK